MSPRAAILIACIGLASAARAEVRCAMPFGDHMVLQRDLPVSVWGTAAPGEAVAVSFAGQEASTRAGSDGGWSVTLRPLPASATGRSLTVTGSNTLEFRDVLVGEVWLCSGQSNMQKPLGPMRGQKPTDGYEAAIAAANAPLLRLFQVPMYAKQPSGGPGLRWWVCSPDALRATNFSAIGYYFGRDLQDALRVPVGIVHSSFGGTQIEAWIPESGFSGTPELAPLLRLRYPAYVPGVQATDLYRSMIAPLAPFAVRGFLWYQGESNCMEADGPIYADKMRALVGSWRKAWGEPEAPFYYVQIAPFDYSRWNKFPRKLTGEELPLFWEAQAAALSIPETGMVATTDLVTDFHDIHPTHKREVARRLANLALERTYGRAALEAESPRESGAEALPDGSIEIRFAHVGSGLSSSDGAALVDFAIAGPDRRFFAAIAHAQGDRVIVSSPNVPHPVAVRFGWYETDHPNLVNSSGLPALPFRTDDWPVATTR